VAVKDPAAEPLQAQFPDSSSVKESPGGGAQ
jgi:hypothetical protein